VIYPNQSPIVSYFFAPPLRVLTASIILGCIPYSPVFHKSGICPNSTTKPDNWQADFRQPANTTDTVANRNFAEKISPLQLLSYIKTGGKSSTYLP